MIRLVPQGQQVLHLLAQWGLQFAQASVTHGMMLGSVRMDLTAIQADVAQFQHSGQLGQQENLHKQFLDFSEKGLAKVGNRVVVGMQTPSNEPKGNTLVGGLFDLARTEKTVGISIKQKSQQDFRRNGFPTHRSVTSIKGAQVRLGHDI